MNSDQTLLNEQNRERIGIIQIAKANLVDDPYDFEVAQPHPRCYSSFLILKVGNVSPRGEGKPLRKVFYSSVMPPITGIKKLVQNLRQMTLQQKFL